MANVITDCNGISFLIGEYINKGSFSKVYTLENCVNKRQYAGKFMSKEKLEKCGFWNKVWEEIRIHQTLRHPNIVEFITYIDEVSHIIIVLEYCSKYSMVNILHNLKTLPVDVSKYFMIQICSAVEYLHKRRIVHRDLKLGNLFVNRYLQVKLGDFGLAVEIEYRGQKRFSRCGTPNYISPEVIQGTGHSFEVDVWALGCILYTMLEGTPPFQAQNTTSTFNKILRCEYCFSPNIDPSAKTFIMSSLQANPLFRPSIFELIGFDFLVSSDIQPRPPDLHFGDGNRFSLFTKRRKMSELNISDVLSVKESENLEFPKIYFFKLLKCLSGVKKWNDSKFGEFLSESSSATPLVWINCWMDYSNNYGFAYQLSNKDVGIIYNDTSRMLYQFEERSFQYVGYNGSVTVFKRDAVPCTLTKKFKLLLYCSNYMKKSLLKAHEPKVPEVQTRDTSMTTELFKWQRGDNEVAMFLTNGSIQVNFLQDHVKVFLCGLTRTATVIESATHMKTLRLDTLQKCGCSKELQNKLQIVSKYIKLYLSEEKSLS